MGIISRKMFIGSISRIDLIWGYKTDLITCFDDAKSM